MKILGAFAAAWAFYRALVAPPAPPVIAIGPQAANQLHWMREFISKEIRANGG